MKCTDKEWQHCRVEKMGCPGCYYDEIKVNEFVRTKYGEISKITDIFVRDEEILLGVKNTIIVNEYGEYGSVIYKDKISKASSNILDLIEIGDILEIKENNDICYLGLAKDTITVNYTDIIEDIKAKRCELISILTKEQYNQNCFKVGD